MSADFCDLHTHTSASDGSLTPTALARYARDKGLRSVGICDHDTISGILSLYPPQGSPDVLRPLIVDGVEIVPGVEINSQWNGRELHILGYYVPFGQGPFQSLLNRMQESRQDCVNQMVLALGRLGMPVDLARVMELSAGDSVGRPHVAKAMAEQGYVKSIKEAFDRYLGIGKPAYVDRSHLTPRESVRAIVRAGGVAVWAHPGTSKALHMLGELVDEGLMGIEAFHPEHDRSTSRKCLDLAGQYGLLATGGSDFHGGVAGEGGDLGSTVVPYAVVSSLRELASTKR
ncbi:MAG: PHP domain-containing protein [Bacillota bacterium]